MSGHSFVNTPRLGMTFTNGNIYNQPTSSYSIRENPDTSGVIIQYPVNGQFLVREGTNWASGDQAKLDYGDSGHQIGATYDDGIFLKSSGEFRFKGESGDVVASIDQTGHLQASKYTGEGFSHTSTYAEFAGAGVLNAEDRNAFFNDVGCNAMFANDSLFVRPLTVRPVTTVNQTGTYTFTTAELWNGLILRSGMTAAVTDIMPSAAAVVTDLGGLADVGVSFSFTFRIDNSASAGAYAPGLGSGGTALSFTSTAASTKAFATYTLILTNVGAGTEAYSLVRTSHFTGATTF